jgi:hypothetical protein
VQLNVTYADGKSYFVWTITNPNPGNGTNGTLQNLSHWTFVAGACTDPNLGIEQNWSDVLGADYKYNAADPWTPIVPIPVIQPDPSQNCTSANVFKFDKGTSGSNATYYRLVLEGHYGTATTTAYFKSGANTGCCSKPIQGIGCKENPFCSYSQGYYFASPGPNWPGGTVTIGGFVYTEAEGRAIWNCSNAGGIKDSKKGFTQVAALKLSNAYPTGNAGIDADVATIENWLATKGKLVACSNLPNQTAGEIAAYGNAAAAAGRIGDWINANHCTED